MNHFNFHTGGCWRNANYCCYLLFIVLYLDLVSVSEGLPHEPWIQINNKFSASSSANNRMARNKAVIKKDFALILWKSQELKVFYNDRKLTILFLLTASPLLWITEDFYCVQHFYLFEIMPFWNGNLYLLIIIIFFFCWETTPLVVSVIFFLKSTFQLCLIYKAWIWDYCSILLD